MAKEKFLLLSLSESKTKELAQAVSNDTCRKILDYLADKEASESELASKLDIPISTVHYNLQQLQKGGLVVVEEYHYSEKGKEVNHYKLANKYIIIAPKSTYGIKEKLKGILPVIGLMAIGSGLIHFFSNGTFNSIQEPVFASKMMVAEVAMDAAVEAVPVALESAKLSLFASLGVWFFVGALASILVYVLIDYLRNKK